MKDGLTVTAGAEIINQIGEEWTGSTSKDDISVVTIRAAKKLSKDNLFNLAAYLRYNFGPCLSGETDSDWLFTAKEISKFFKKYCGENL